MWRFLRDCLLILRLHTIFRALIILGASRGHLCDIVWFSCNNASISLRSAKKTMELSNRCKGLFFIMSWGHVKRTVSRCFAALRQLRQIRRSVPPATFQSPWWSSWCYPGWIIRKSRTGCMVFRLTWYTSFTVGTECRSTADLSYEIRRPHHRRSCLPSLSARPGTDRFTRPPCWAWRRDVQSFTRKCMRRGIWDHSFLLLISPADGHYALVAPIVWWCHLSDV